MAKKPIEPLIVAALENLEESESGLGDTLVEDTAMLRALQAIAWALLAIATSTQDDSE